MKPSIRPVVWSPPPVRPLQPRAPLPPIRRLSLPALGEDVAIDSAGRLVCGLSNGQVVRIQPERGAIETLVDTGGRPLGIEIDADGSLIVCDAKRGLLRVHPDTRKIEVLADPSLEAINLCNNAAIARDGTIYFSDSSRRFPLEHWQADLVEHSGTGRLFRRSPDGTLEVLCGGLQFANGVALAADESFVIVAETGAYRLTRVWLTGPRAGQRDVFHDTPGFPDNIASDDKGRIWVAVATPRNPTLDLLHRTPPILRKIMWRLPDRLQPKPARTTCVLALDEDGEVVHALAGTSPSFHMITGLRVRGDQLYVASLAESAIGVMTLP